jgi:hypothetical protein
MAFNIKLKFGNDGNEYDVTPTKDKWGFEIKPAKTSSSIKNHEIAPAKIYSTVKTSDKEYNINGLKVSCPYIIKKTYVNNQEIYASETEQLCDLLSKVNSSASYNFDRIKKLNDEYKCSTSYHFTKSVADLRPMPDCQAPVYNLLTSKFESSSLAVSNVKNLIDGKQFNTYSAQIFAQNAIDNLSSLKSFTEQNKFNVNAAFEKASYDTNAAGVGTALASLTGIGIFLAFANELLNNEFDGKIDRAYDDAITLKDNLITIGEIISHYHSDIYVG